MDGIINVYKEQGFTSHDVVAKLRGILHMKKIGHTGTLDPDAVGVLPVCLGKGTKLCGLITDWDKTYEAQMLLGTVTDTQDITGTVLETRPVCVDERTVLEAITSFIGNYQQIPPMYSALKYNGKKLYELAREGIEVERRARTVHIRDIRINEMNLSDEQKTVTFTVECSKGTYIRALCDDIGKKLGCGACMKKLERTRVGRFTADDSLTLNQISALVLKGVFEQYIVPVEDLFDYPRLTVGPLCYRQLYNGNRLDIGAVTASMPKDSPEETAFIEQELYCIFDEQQQFVGLYQYGDRSFTPVKMFYTGGNE